MSGVDGKKIAVEKLSGQIQKSKGIYLTEGQGIGVNIINLFRRKCREVGGRYVTAKNTLAKRALGQAGIAGLEEDLKGPTSMVIALDDPVAAAKVISEFANENKEKFKIKRCVVEGKVLAGTEVSKLAALPSREILLGQLLSVLNAPMRNLAGVLSEILRKVPAAIDAVAKQKAAQQK